MSGARGGRDARDGFNRSLRGPRAIVRPSLRYARMVWPAKAGTLRKPLRSIRRDLLAEHERRTGKRPSGRQWVRLRKALQRARRGAA